MTTMDARTAKEDLLVGGLDDWADASWVYGRVWDVSDDYEVRRTMAIGLIAEVVIAGLMVPGDVDDAGHHPWPHSPGDAIERIVRQWLTEWLDEIPTPGAIVWLANTETGSEIARHVLARETRSL